MKPTICVKDPQIDSYVSKNIILGNGWEVEETNKVLEAVEAHPGAVFLGNIILIIVYSHSIFYHRSRL